ncbi:MAG: hypothetical protein AB7P04_14340 [Bacteriovoracia bacterium]
MKSKKKKTSARRGPSSRGQRRSTSARAVGQRREGRSWEYEGISGRRDLNDRHQGMMDREPGFSSERRYLEDRDEAYDRGYGDRNRMSRERPEGDYPRRDYSGYNDRERSFGGTMRDNRDYNDRGYGIDEREYRDLDQWGSSGHGSEGESFGRRSRRDEGPRRGLRVYADGLNGSSRGGGSNNSRRSVTRGSRGTAGSRTYSE